MARLWRKQLARNLKNPQANIFGYFAKERMVKCNDNLEENAAKLCKIKPHHNVLEVGFGPGIGLKKALEYVKDGPGRVFGVDISSRMVRDITVALRDQVSLGKVVIFEGSVANIPCPNDLFDRVFHVDTFYYWGNLDAAVQELYRVMKTNSYMVVPYNLDRLTQLYKKKILYSRDFDPLNLKLCLERQGFTDIKTESFWDDEKKESFDVIFARLLHKRSYFPKG